MRAPLEQVDYKPAQFHDFAKVKPIHNDSSGRTWWMRGQNFVSAYSQARKGARFVREIQPDEYMLYLPDDASATITAGGTSALAPGNSLSIIPPGASEVRMEADGQAIFIFSSKAKDLVDRCFNKDAYATPDPLVTLLKPWPDPLGGYKLRVYALADYPATAYPSLKRWTHDSSDTRFGRYFRTTGLMVHLHQRVAARDQGKTLPHAQLDYEQAALCLTGERIHHVRTPWGPDVAKWREDEHVTLDSPSFLVFPPGLIHTTTTVSEGAKWVDIFSPPRADISARPGWVRNEAEYPLPEPEAQTVGG
jgi:hypothetical protein